MFPFTIKLQCFALSIALIVPFAYGQDRKITPKLNPGCQSCPKNYMNNSLVYVRAEGNNDIVHQLWDFTWGIPTIIFLIGSLESNITVFWDSMTPRSFVINEKPKYSFALAFDKLYEYDDIEDIGRIDRHSPQKEYSLKNQQWTISKSILTDKEAMLCMHTIWGHSGEINKGSIDVKLDLLPYKDYAVDLPHLIHTANSTLIDVRFVNLTTSPEFNSSRFALRMLLLSTDDVTDTMHTTMRKSLDDEHTPGVFEIIEIRTPSSYLHSDGGFLQFRPVGYTTPERGVSSSTDVRLSDFNDTRIPERSTLRKFYSDFDKKKILAQNVLFSFGVNGDGFYKSHNYTSWSFTMGYGAPPVEGFSLFVIIIISIGLGVPVLLALSGILFVVVRRLRQRNRPSRLTEDE